MSSEKERENSLTFIHRVALAAATASAASSARSRIKLIAYECAKGRVRETNSGWTNSDNVFNSVLITCPSEPASPRRRQTVDLAESLLTEIQLAAELAGQPASRPTNRLTFYPRR